MIDAQPPLLPAKLVTGHEAPTHCPFCRAPRFAIDGPRIVFACNTAAVFPRQILCEGSKNEICRPTRIRPGQPLTCIKCLREIPADEIRNPKVKQTLKCIALAKAGGWKREEV